MKQPSKKLEILTSLALQAQRLHAATSSYLDVTTQEQRDIAWRAFNAASRAEAAQALLEGVDVWASDHVA